MTVSRRALLIGLLAGLLLLLGLLFSRFVLDNVITPVALVFWVVWRLIRSVDQALYWNLLFFAAVGYAILFFVRRTESPPDYERLQPSEPDFLRERIKYWRTSIELTREQPDKLNLLKRNLGEMLASMYAAKQTEIAPYEFYAALQRGQIPLPDHIHAFLFPEESRGAGRSFRKMLHALLQIPGKQVRRWTGQEVTEYYHSIEEVIQFMETTMETRHDDGQFEIQRH